MVSLRAYWRVGRHRWAGSRRCRLRRWRLAGVDWCRARCSPPPPLVGREAAQRRAGGLKITKGTTLMHADVLRAINVQINSEFSAWYQYLAMAAFCEREQFVGAGKWLQSQSAEEYQHGMKLFNFLLARNGAVELTAIDEPKREFESFGEVFEQALKQEM